MLLPFFLLLSLSGISNAHTTITETLPAKPPKPCVIVAGECSEATNSLRKLFNDALRIKNITEDAITLMIVDGHQLIPAGTAAIQGSSIIFNAINMPNDEYYVLFQFVKSLEFSHMSDLHYRTLVPFLGGLLIASATALAIQKYKANHALVMGSSVVMGIFQFLVGEYWNIKEPLKEVISETGTRLLEVGRADVLEHLLASTYTFSASRYLTFGLQVALTDTEIRTIIHETLAQGVTSANYPAYKYFMQRSWQERTATEEDKRAELRAAITAGTKYQFASGFNVQVALPARLLRELCTGHDDGINTDRVDQELLG